MEDFILTHNYFIESADLIEKLFDRYTTVTVSVHFYVYITITIAGTFIIWYPLTSPQLQ